MILLKGALFSRKSSTFSEKSKMTAIRIIRMMAPKYEPRNFLMIYESSILIDFINVLKEC
jgi:hypothetical protein